MPKMSSHLLLFYLYLLLLSISCVFSKSNLDCDFSSDCCWATTHEDDQWEVRDGDELDLNDFRKTFLTGKSRPPPSGNYAIRVENKKMSSLISCAVCTQTGQATVKFRHWQSANAMLKICWQLEGDGSPLLDNCKLAKHSRQSKLNSYKFENIDKNANFRLVFIVENADASLNGGHEATIIIDRITVDYDSCGDEHRPTHSVKSESSTKQKKTHKPKQRARSSTTLDKLAEKEEQVNIRNKKKVTEDAKQQAYLKNVDRQIAKVVDEVNAKQLSIKTTNATTKTPSNPKANGPVDPLTDLLGTGFVDFLDPNYESGDEEDEEIDGDKKKTSTPKGKVEPKTTIAPAPPQKTLTVPIKRVETATKQIDANGIKLPPKNLQPVEHLPIRPIPQPDKDNILKFITRGKPMQVQTQNGAFTIAAPAQQPIPLGIPSTCSTPGGCLFEADFCGWTTPNGVNNKFHMKKVHMSSFAEAVVPIGEVAVIETTTNMTQAHTILFDSLEFTTGVRLIGCCLSEGQFTCPFSTPSEQTGVIWQFSKFECPVNTSKMVFICENFGLTTSICAIDNIRIHTSTDVFFLEACQKDRLH